MPTIYDGTDKDLTRTEVREAVGKLPHVKVRYNSDLKEWRVAYRGLKPQREEAMAHYTDYGHDAVGTAIHMERAYTAHVFDCDKLQKTIDQERNPS